MTLAELPTPAVLVDGARARRNLDRLAAAAAARGIALRPHAKTHKSPVVAAWQRERGAVGICCAKIGEAEVFAEAGGSNIRIPYPLHPVNADRVAALSRRTHLSFIVDHLAVAEAWSQAMTRAGVRVDVLVKVDVGFHRCGIAPDAATAVPLVTAVSRLPGLRLRGLLSHAGQAYHARSEGELQAIAVSEANILRSLATELRQAGVAIDELSAGATPTARFSLQQDGLTEYRAGNFVYYDRTQVGLGAATMDDCALSVLTRVVSTPAADRLVLDAGSKILSSDGARGFVPAPGYGTVLARQPSTGGPSVAVDAVQTPDDTLLVERLSEEHATVRVLNGVTGPALGDLVRIIPNHACVVSNLVDQAWLVDEGEVTPLVIAARGRSQ